jgi:hypothetical protein
MDVRHGRKEENGYGPMLIEKRKPFKEAYNILEDHCLTGTGWLKSFKKA